MKHRTTAPLPHDLRIDRREFLLALGGGLPLLAQGCDDAESVHLRGAEIDPEAQRDVAPPQLAGAASLSIQVLRTLSIQSKSVGSDDRLCSIPKSFDEVVAVGDQVRIIRNDSEYALYTVGELRNADDPDQVRVGLQGRLRLGTSKAFSGTLRIPVVAEGLTDAQAEAANEFVERLVDDGSNTRLIVFAPHGGAIELYTDLQAEHVRASLAGLGTSAWICKGWKAGGGAHERWHITSTAISPRSFPQLATIASRGFAHAVSFHGMSTGGGVLIGGNAPLELKLQIRHAIAAALDDSKISVTVAAAMDHYDGDSPDNIVNWMTVGGTGGVQIEQDIDVRTDYWQQVADAVVGVYQQLL